MKISDEAKKELEDAKKAKAEFLKQRDGGNATDTPAPAATPATTPATPDPKVDTPAVVPSPDADQLRQQLADREAKIAELTKRLRDEDGSRGGRLQTLTQALETAQQQITELTAANKAVQEALAKQNAPKPEEIMAKRRKAILDRLPENSRLALEAAGVLDATLDTMLAQEDGREKPPATAPDPRVDDLNKKVDTFVAETETQRFNREVEAQEGGAGFGAANDGNDKAWGAFLASPKDPADPDVTWLEHFQLHATPQRAAAVWRAFKAQKTSAAPVAPKTPEPPKTPATPSLESLATPAPGAAAAPKPGERQFTRVRLEQLQEIVMAPRKLTDKPVDPKLVQEWREHMDAAAKGLLVG